MTPYSRGDVEFLAIELFLRAEGDRRAWETWDSTPTQAEFRARAIQLLEAPCEVAKVEPVIIDIFAKAQAEGRTKGLYENEGLTTMKKPRKSNKPA